MERGLKWLDGRLAKDIGSCVFKQITVYDLGMIVHITVLTRFF